MPGLHYVYNTNYRVERESENEPINVQRELEAHHQENCQATGQVETLEVPPSLAVLFEPSNTQQPVTPTLTPKMGLRSKFVDKTSVHKRRPNAANPKALAAMSAVGNSTKRCVDYFYSSCYPFWGRSGKCTYYSVLV